MNMPMLQITYKSQIQQTETVKGKTLNKRNLKV